MNQIRHCGSKSTILIIIIFTLMMVTTNAWASPTPPRSAGIQEPAKAAQNALPTSIITPLTETRIPGHMDRVPAALRGQAGRWELSRSDRSNLDDQAVVWVDDAWVGTTIGTVVSLPCAPGSATFGTDAFATVHEGIAAAGSGAIVHVFPGTYHETTTGCLLYNNAGPYQFGLFLPDDKPGLTIEGVDATGVAITDYNNVAAEILYTATNSFGTSGIFVEADNATINGLWIHNEVTQPVNKTLEIIGNAFTMKYCKIDDWDATDNYGGSTYLNDWRVNTATDPDESHVQTYTIEHNYFPHNNTIDIASGAGMTGASTNRLIRYNTFDSNNDVYSSVSFMGTVPAIGWYIYPVGGAEIKYNTFSNGASQYIKARGDYDNSTFDWASYWNDNTFDKKVAHGSNPPSVINEYTYSDYAHTRRIGTVIQDEIYYATAGETVLVGAGSYVENVTIDKSITLNGSGATTTTLYPAVSDPGTCPGSGSYSNSQMIIVSAHNVTISNLTVDGDNPALTSGTVVHGADLDARNGIIESNGPWNNLNVHDCTVKNIYLRGIYARSGGSGFHIYNNTVQNVDACYASIGIFNWAGTGIIEYNNVSYCGDAISANWSRGTQFLHNTVTNSGSGVHSDNGGTPTATDLIQDNNVSNSAANGYGVWVFFPYSNAVVDNNTVTNVDIGLFAWGGAGGVASFTNNTVDGQNRAGSIGCYATCGPNAWGSYQSNVNASFTNNSISNTPYGFVVESNEAPTYYSTSATVSGQSFAGTTYEVYVTGLGPIAVTGLLGNTVLVGYPARIQDGIGLAATGGTVWTSSGTYTEAINLNKSISLIGTGSGPVAASNTILTQTPGGSVDSKVGVIQLTASGISTAQPILVQDLRILPVGMAALSVGRFTEGTGQTVENIKLDNVFVSGTNVNPSTEQERGLYVDLTSTLRHLEVVDCAFNNLCYGWYFQKAVSADASNVRYVTVSNTTFNHNNHKGLYAEKLSDASFTGCTVDNNGFDSAILPSYFSPWSCGVDVNLKAGSYSNLTFDNCIVSNNAHDQSKEGVGMGLKARDDGGTYGPFPASLNNVIVTNCTFTGNERGLRVGEPTKNNASPTGVVASYNTFCNNTKHYSGSDGSAYGDLINQSTAAVNAEHNYWCTVVPTEVAAKTANASTGSVDFQPWCNADFSICDYTMPVHNITRGIDYPTITSAVAAANPGDLITADHVVFNEHNILINKSLTLTGDPGDAQPGPGANAPILDGQGLYTDAFLIANGTANVTIQGFEIRNYVNLGENGEGNAVQAWVASTNHITIADNYMHDLGWNGVLVGNDGARGDHSYWTIARNILTNFGTGVFSRSGYGFELTNTSHGLIEDNVITAGSLKPGCAILATVRRPSEVDITIRRNSISGEFDYYGIALYAYNVEVPNPNLNGVVIENNSLDISGPCLYALSIREFGGTVTNSVVRDNRLVKAGGGGLLSNTAQPINASANWWDSNVETTVAARINGVADFTPFLDNGNDTAPGTLGFQGDFHTLDVTTLGAQTGLLSRIQEAVNMVSGSTINLLPGTYVGQVIVNAFPTAMNIVGMGATPADVVIKAVPSMTPITGTDRRPVVSIMNTNTVNLLNLTVDGDHQGSTNSRMFGVAYWNAGGSMTNCDVLRVEDTAFSGAQHGVGVYGNNNDIGTFGVALNNVRIVDFQKNAMAFSGVGFNVDIDNCICTGAGDTPVTAQNGIQIGYGATGTIDHCTISGISYTGTGWTSSGILLYASGTVNIGTSTMINTTQSAVYAYNSSGSFVNSSITGNANSDLGVLAYNDNAGLLPHRGRTILPLVESNTAYLNHRALDATASFNVSGSTITGDYKAGSVGVEGYCTAGSLNMIVNNNRVTRWDNGIALVSDGGPVASATVTNNVLTNTADAQDNTPGHTWDANCYADFGTNPGFPAQYNVPGSTNVDYHPNSSGCSNVDLTIVDPYIGCATGCNNTDVVKVSIDQAGLTNLELIIQLPIGFALNVPNGTDIRPFIGNDPHVTAAWVNAIAGNQINIAFTWEPPYSSGVSTQYIAEIPVINSSAGTGTYAFAGVSSVWADDQGNMHPNTLVLGTVAVKVDCQIPAITVFSNSATCAFGASTQMLNKFTAVFNRGAAPGDALLESAWITSGANSFNLAAFNPALNPDTIIFPTTPTDAATLYGWLANNACTTITLHVKDVKCNEATAVLEVGRDETAPNLTVTPASVGCVNDNPASPQYGAEVLDNVLNIAADLGTNACMAGTGTLTIAYGPSVYGTTLSLPVVNYPDSVQAVALWTWMKTVLAGANGDTYTFDVTATDCAGNSVMHQFNICVDLTIPDNTVSFFDARPADAGVWLAWQWTASSQAVTMEIWRSPISGDYPQYPNHLWNNIANYSDAVYPPAGWTKVTTQTAVSGTLTSADNAAVNNLRGDHHTHVDGSWTYWLDADAGWSNANNASTFRDIYRYITFVKDAGGNWSINKPVHGHWDYPTAGNADRSTNYWLGDFATADASGMSGSRGYVDSEDLGVLATSYFKQVGAGAAAYCNIGPVVTENGNVGKGIPNPDVNGFVNFYDLVPFSFNYNMVSPVDSIKEFLIMPDPNAARAFSALDAVPTVSVCRTIEQEIVTGQPFSVTVALNGNDNGTVKAVEAVLTYNADMLEFVSATSPAVTLNQGELFSKVSPIEGQIGEIGMVAAALGNGAAITNNAILSTITFRWKSDRSGNVDLALTAVRLADGNGGTLDGSGNVLSIGAVSAIPEEYSLHQNFPNPFNPSTEIAFDLKAGGFVTLDVFNVLGQRVASLVNTNMEAGKHRITFDASNLSTGVYVYQIQVNGFTAHRKMLLMR